MCYVIESDQKGGHPDWVLPTLASMGGSNDSRETLATCLSE